MSKAELMSWFLHTEFIRRWDPNPL
jgi:hypothetical protein